MSKNRAGELTDGSDRRPRLPSLFWNCEVYVTQKGEWSKVGFRHLAVACGGRRVGTPHTPAFLSSKVYTIHVLSNVHDRGMQTVCFGQKTCSTFLTYPIAGLLLSSPNVGRQDMGIQHDMLSDGHLSATWENIQNKHNPNGRISIQHFISPKPVLHHT